MRDYYPFTSVDNGGPIPGDRLAEIRESAEYANIDIYAEELLWLLEQADEAKRLRDRIAMAEKAVRDAYPWRCDSPAHNTVCHLRALTPVTRALGLDEDGSES